MPIDVVLPPVGEGVDSGEVVSLYVKEGDTVEKDQALFELGSDKASVDVPSPAAGVISKLMIEMGQNINVGDVVAQLEGSGASAPAPAPAEPAKPAPEPAKPVEAPEPAETPKVETPVAPPPQPTPAAPVAPVAAAPAPVAPAVPTPPAVEPSSSVIPASPAVRRFAREVGVDLQHVAGTGDGGRIQREDVLRAVRESNTPAAPAAAPPAAPVQGTLTTTEVPKASPVGGNKPLTLPGEPGQDQYGPVRVEKLSRIRKAIAAQMHKSWSTVPRVTNFDDADVTDLETFRKSSKDDYLAQGIKLTTLPFLIKAVSASLRAHPTMNAVIDMDGETITYRDYVNIGIAVDTDNGLVVPNIQHADSMSIPEIAKALADMASRVRSGDFGVNELKGGTFTISNLGAIGGTYSTPIVNVPEVAILLVGRTRKLPVVMDDDSIQARQMMPLSLSYDHRLVDGGTAARFLNEVIAYLEAPSRLLLAIS